MFKRYVYIGIRAYDRISWLILYWKCDRAVTWNDPPCVIGEHLTRLNLRHMTLLIRWRTVSRKQLHNIRDSQWNRHTFSIFPDIPINTSYTYTMYTCIALHGGSSLHCFWNIGVEIPGKHYRNNQAKLSDIAYSCQSRISAFSNKLNPDNADILWNLWFLCQAQHFSLWTVSCGESGVKSDIRLTCCQLVIATLNDYLYISTLVCRKYKADGHGSYIIGKYIKYRKFAQKN